MRVKQRRPQPEAAGHGIGYKAAGVAGGYLRNKSISTSLSSKIIVDVSALLSLLPQLARIDRTYDLFHLYCFHFSEPPDLSR